jgi:hypothetical protein
MSVAQIQLTADRGGRKIIPLVTSRVCFVALMLAARSRGHGANAVVGATHASASADWAVADTQTPRLVPSGFPVLNPHREELSHRGCRIPQSFLRSEPHTVIVGAFAGVGFQNLWTPA